MSNDNEFYFSAFRDNNRKAMQQIYDEIYPLLHNYILKNSGRPDQVWDICGRALEITLLKIRFEEITPATLKVLLPGYIYGIAKNLWFGELRNQKLDLINSPVGTHNSDDDNDQGDKEDEQFKLYEEKLLELGVRCRELLEARLQGLSYKSLAKTLEYSTPNAAAVRHFQCKEQLIKKIKDDPRF